MPKSIAIIVPVTKKKRINNVMPICLLIPSEALYKYTLTLARVKLYVYNQKS
jgi:hypothetical protein